MSSNFSDGWLLSNTRRLLDNSLTRQFMLASASQIMIRWVYKNWKLVGYFYEDLLNKGAFSPQLNEQCMLPYNTDQRPVSSLVRQL